MPSMMTINKKARTKEPNSRSYRVIAPDRRGHGRSTQTDRDNDMDTYAADVAALVSICWVPSFMSAIQRGLAK